MRWSDELREAALRQAANDAELRELVRRCVEAEDEQACAELDRRGIEPPLLELGPEPVPVS